MRRLSAGGVPWLLMWFYCLSTAVLCSSSSMTGDIGKRAEALEGSLLNMFGMKRRPRPGKDAKIVIPEFLIELYRQQTGLEVDTTNLNLAGKMTQSANTVRTFVHQESNKNKNDEENQVHLSFDMSSLPAEEALKAGELRLYRSPASASSEDDTSSNKWRRKQQVLIHEIVRPAKKRNPASVVADEDILRLLDSRIVDVRDEGWLTFDVLPALLRWRENPKRNYGLRLEVRPVTGRGADPVAEGSLSDIQHLHLRKRRSSDDLQWASQQPLLVTYSDDGKARTRTKRAAEKKHKRKGRRDNCRRQSLYVDFSDVGWNDWIVAPPGYHAYYCHGECPFPLPDHLNTTNHAIVQTLVNSVNPSAVPRACCVPTELSSISMLYIDEYDKVVLKNYHDMVVEACGCR